MACLIESYINALNKGVAPSIENTWSYICKIECGKAFKEAKELYDVRVVKLAEQHIPMGSPDLRNLHKTGKKTSIDHFIACSVG